MAVRARIWLACCVIAALILICDLALLPGAVAAFCVVIVLISARSPRQIDTALATVGCVLLIIGGAFVTAVDAPALNIVLVNRGASLVAVFATALAVNRWRQSSEALAALNRNLEERVEQRTGETRQRASELADANALLEKEVQQRERAEITARNSQAVYASLVEDLPIPIIRKDLNGRFLFANRAFCSWVGYRRDEIVGHTDFDFAPPALAEKYRDDDQSVIDTGELFLDVEKNEHGGSVNWVHVIKTPARDGEGAIVGTQAIFWDVTAKREAEDRVRDSEALYHSLVDYAATLSAAQGRRWRVHVSQQALVRVFRRRAGVAVGQDRLRHLS